MAQQTLTGNAKTLGAVASGGTVTCSPSEYPQSVSGILLSPAVVTSTISAVTGNFSISVPRGAKVKVVCKDSDDKIFLNEVIHVSDDSTLDISAYLNSNTVPTGGVGAYVTSVNGASGAVTVSLASLGAAASVYADNTAALAGGLVAGDLYRTSTGVLMIVY